MREAVRTRLILKKDCVQTTQLELGKGKSQSKNGSMKGKRRGKCSQDEYREVDPVGGSHHVLSHA